MLSFERCFESIGNWAVIAIEVKPVLVLAEISALVPEWPAKLRDESGDFTVFVLQGLGICVFFVHPSLTSLHSAQGRTCHRSY